MGMTTATSVSPQITEKIRAVLRQLNGVIAGKPAQVQGSVVCLLAGGHLLIDYEMEERRVGKECRSRWSPYH